MKKLKKIFSLWTLIFVLLCSALFSGARIPTKSYAAAPDDTSTAIDSDFFNLVTITKQGQTLGLENIIQKDGKSYIFTNESITFSLHAYRTPYNIDFGEYASNFTRDTESITISPNALGRYPSTIELFGTTYYIEVANGTRVNIYASDPSNTLLTPIVSTASSTELNSTIDGSNVITLTYTTRFTFKANATSHIKINNYELYLFKTIIDFSNGTNQIVNFEALYLGGDVAYSCVPIIPEEQQFSTVQIDFTNNTYTEENPLYFNINYNGFIFNFMLYSKVYDGNNLLFVNYFDNSKTKYLATMLVLDESENLVPQASTALDASTETFSLVFRNTGRYEIEIYDSTYIAGFENPNYMSKSFYIVKEDATPFNNIYIIAQSIDDEGAPIEYIVSSSTINNDVEVSIKNLTTEDENISNTIDRVEVVKAIFGASDNDPIYYNISPEAITNPDLLSSIELDVKFEDGDLVFKLTEDAYYQIRVYQKNNTSLYTEFNFTIVKQAKTSYKVKTGPGPEDYVKHDASTPFQEEIIDYEFVIPAKIQVLIKYTSVTTTEDTTLDKSYINKYRIRYGMQQVAVERHAVLDKDGKEISGTIQLQFFGVGALVVEVDFNGTTTTYNINSTETLTFSEVGVYNVKVTDSMGTEGTYTYEIKKSLNTSAIVLIVLSAVLVLIIVAFILSASGKVKTR